MSRKVGTMLPQSSEIASGNRLRSEAYRSVRRIFSAAEVEVPSTSSQEEYVVAPLMTRGAWRGILEPMSDAAVSPPFPVELGTTISPF